MRQCYIDHIDILTTMATLVCASKKQKKMPKECKAKSGLKTVSSEQFNASQSKLHHCSYSSFAATYYFDSSQKLNDTIKTNCLL